MTKRDVIRLERSVATPAHHQFVLNWARHQDGWAVAKKIAASIQAGCVVRAAQLDNGYFIDGIFWSADCLRDPLSRPWR